MPPYLMIVSRDRESLYDELRVMYEDSQRVHVILNRRVDSDRRRARSAWSGLERRRGDRRRLRPDVEAHLQILGWVFVRAPHS